MSRPALVLGSFLCCALPAVGAPVQLGGPRLSVERPGGAVADFGSRYAVKAETLGERQDRLGALAFYDARPGAVPGNPVAGNHGLGAFSLRFSQAGVSKLSTGRTITYRLWGWEETATEGGLSVSVQVFTLSRNLFAVVAQVQGVSEPLRLEARIDGKVRGAATVDAGPTAPSSVLTLDNLENRPFGLNLSTTGTVEERSGFSGQTYGASTVVELQSDETVGFLLAFHDDPAQVRAFAAALEQAQGAPSAWLEGIREDWEAHLAAFSKPHEGDPARLEADRRAIALLRMNEVGPAGYPSKTHGSYFWGQDVTLQALGVSEASATRAFDSLAVLYDGQLSATSHAELGMLPHHVDELGDAPPLGVEGTTDFFSHPPALGAVLRELHERAGRDDAAREQLSRAFDVSLPYLDWWARRRDRDGDGLFEANGGLEGGAENSPRYTELYGNEVAARLPVPDTDARPRLNSVDLNCWLYLYEVELARLAQALGRPEADSLFERASQRLFRMNDPAEGFWDEERGAYFDFVRTGSELNRRLLESRTSSMWFPLYVGAVRDADRVRRLVEKLTDPNAFWGEHGVPSTAFNDAAFDPDSRWRGPVWLSVNYAAMVGLFRYGYEEEAEALRQRVLTLVASQDGLWEHYDARSGAGLGAYQFGPSGALYLQAARNRHQAETFATRKGGPAASRTGYLRRIYRLSDARPLAELRVADTYEVPLTTLSAPTQLFAEEPMTLTFADPHALVGEREVTVTFPLFESLTFTRRRADGSRETSTLEREEPFPLAVTARVGDTLELSRFQFAGQGGCGCGAAGMDAGALLAGALLLLRLRRRPSA